MPFIEAVAFPDLIAVIVSLALILLVVGVSGSSSKSKQTGTSTTESGTRFPWEMLQSGGQYLGKMPTMEDLARLAPSTTGLFGGTTGLYQPQAYQAPAGNQVGISNVVQPTAQQQGQPAQVQPTAPKTYSMSDFAATLAKDSHGKYRIPMVQQRLSNAGYDPNNFTLEQLQKVTQGDSDILIGKGVRALADEAATQQAVMQQEAATQQAVMQPQVPQFVSQTVAPGIGAALPAGMEGSIANLGFGQTPQTYTQREVGAAPEVTARGVADIFTPGGRQRLSNEMFEAQYLPVERRLNLEQQQADKALNAQLAQAGLASSGAGIGQRAQQGLEYTRERAAAAKEAAANAAAQSQQMRLEASGIDVTAQTAAADNVLKGNMANATNYLEAIKLSTDEAAKARQQFLDLLGLQEDDLKRMDQAQLSAITTLLEPFLAEWGILGQLGEYQLGTETSKKTSKSGSGGMSLSTGSTSAG
jgi:hypothetical protein